MISSTFQEKFDFENPQKNESKLQMEISLDLDWYKQQSAKLLIISHGPKEIVNALYMVGMAKAFFKTPFWMCWPGIFEAAEKKMKWYRFIFLRTLGNFMICDEVVQHAAKIMMKFT